MRHETQDNTEYKNKTVIRLLTELSYRQLPLGHIFTAIAYSILPRRGYRFVENNYNQIQRKP